MRSGKWFRMLLVVTLAGCAEAAGAEGSDDTAGKADKPTPATPPANPTPAPTMSDAVHWTRNAAEKRALFLQAYKLAALQLEAQLATANQQGPSGWAVSIDADETLVDNSQYQKENDGKPFSAEAWTEWVKRRQAKALPGARAFLERVRQLGGKIAVVTNRSGIECPDTIVNFVNEQLPYDLMLCKTDTSDKNPRFAAIEAGTADPTVAALKIRMFVGDNILDFPKLSQDMRRLGDEAFADFGTRFFILPNPMYGSWTKNARD